MAATVLKETKPVSAIGTQPPSAAVVMKHNSSQAMEVELVPVKCYCCSLSEECTLSYITRVRDNYRGRWICGLCAEAVKDETLRSRRDISTDEALKRLMMFCQQLKFSSPPNNSAEELIGAMKQLLRRTLDSPRKEPLSCRPWVVLVLLFSHVRNTERESAI